MPIYQLPAWPENPPWGDSASNITTTYSLDMWTQNITLSTGRVMTTGAAWVTPFVIQNIGNP